METILTPEMMQECDKKTIESTISEENLIAKVGKRLAPFFNKFDQVVIITGKGNNGADGFALAASLLKTGKDISIYMVDKPNKIGQKYVDEFKKDDRVVFLDKLQEHYECVIDAIFGINYHDDYNGIYDDIIDKINSINAFHVSIDINTGLSAFNGIARKAIKSDLTIAIQNYKTGHFLNDAKDYIKKLEVIDVGIDTSNCKENNLFTYDDFRKLFPQRLHNSNKKTYGYVSIFGGSKRYPGACKLSTLATISLLSGCGIVRLCVPENIATSLSSSILEATLFPLPNDYNEDLLKEAIKNQDVIAFGMGLEINEVNKKNLDYILKNYEGKLLIDAAGIYMLDRSLLYQTKAKVILTPHPKEMVHIFGDSIESVLQLPFFYARNLTDGYPNIVCCLKGATTLIVNDGKMYFIDKGNAALSKGGSGDILSGIIAGMAGYMDILAATLAGNYLFLTCGEIASKKYGIYSTLGRNVIHTISQEMAKMGRK